MYEYKVVPAPRQGLKAKGVKTPEDRFSLALETQMNSESLEGWEFVRAETLPSDERSGFRSTTTVYRSVLIFRRALEEAVHVEEAAAPVPPVIAEPEPEAEYEPEHEMIDDTPETLEEPEDDPRAS